MLSNFDSYEWFLAALPVLVYLPYVFYYAMLIFVNGAKFHRITFTCLPFMYFSFSNFHPNMILMGILIVLAVLSFRKILIGDEVKIGFQG